MWADSTNRDIFFSKDPMEMSRTFAWHNFWGYECLNPLAAIGVVSFEALSEASTETAAPSKSGRVDPISLPFTR